jgi:hypothetical protein
MVPVEEELLKVGFRRLACNLFDQIVKAARAASPDRGS